MPISVSIVEGEESLRSRLSALLKAAIGFELLGVYAEVSEASSAILHDRPSVVLIDLHLPAVLDCIEKITSALPSLQVLVLASQEDENLVIAALKAGAAGSMRKDMPLSDLLKTIGNVYRGGVSIPPHVAPRLKELHSPPPAPVPSILPPASQPNLRA